MNYIRLFCLMFFVLLQTENQIFSQQLKPLEQQLFSNDESSKPEILNRLAKHYLKNDIEKSFSYSKESLMLSKKNKNRLQEAEAFRNLGNYFSIKNNFYNAKQYYDSSLQIFKSLEEYHCIAEINSLIGNLYQAQGNFDKTLQYYLKSLDMNIFLKDTFGIASDFYEIGNCYFEQENFKKAFDFFDEALLYSKKQNITKLIISSLVAQGKILIDDNKLHEASKKLIEAEKYCLTTNDKQNQYVVYYCFGKLFLKQTNINQAISNADKAKNLYDELKLKNAELYILYSEIFLKTKDFRKSLENSNIAKQIAEKQRDAKYLLKIYKQFQKIYESSGNFELAYRSLLKINNLTDSLIDAENKNQHLPANTDFKNNAGNENLNNIINDQINNKKELATKELYEKFFIVAFIFLAIVLAYFVRFYLKYKQENISLLKKEDNFLRILEHIPFMLIGFDKSNQLIFWNKECEKVTGYSFNEIKNNFDFIESITKEFGIVKKISSKYFDNQDNEKKTEINFTSKSDAVKTIECTFFPFSENNSQVDYWVIANEISEIKNFSDFSKTLSSFYKSIEIISGLLVSNQNFEDVINQSLEILGKAVKVNRVYIFKNEIDNISGLPLMSQKFEWSFDVSEQISNEILQKLPYFPNYSRWFKTLSEKQTIHGRVSSFPIEEQEILMQQNIVSLLVSPISINNEFWGFIGFDDCQTERLWKDSEIKLLLTMSTLIGSLIVLKETESFLTRSEETVKNIFVSSPDAIIVSNSSGNILKCNPAAITLYNCKNEHELIGSNILEFLLPNEREKMRDVIFALKINKENKNQIFSIVQANGKTIKTEISTALINIINAKEFEFVAIIKDITEQDKFINQLEESKKQAVESDRLKSSFLANMSHEIRTPLNSIIGFSKLLTDEETDNKSKKSYIESIVSSSNSLLHLIDDIIDISRIESDQMTINKTVCNINQIFTEIYLIYYELAKPKTIEIRLILGSKEKEYYISTDPNRLRQVIENLMQNALKYTHNGYIEFGYEIIDSQKVEFFVKDTGIGISHDKYSIIFDQFRQVDDSLTRQYGGIGLGLTISSKLIKLLGGEIWLQSTVNMGTSFYFTLPNSMINVNIESVKEIEEEKSIPNWFDKTILIAEDIQQNYNLLYEFLKPTNVKIFWVKNGKDAVDLCKIHKINIVLMDIQMPEMDGYKATKLIKEFNPRIVVVAETAFAMLNDRDKILASGFDDYLAKPIRPDVLINTLIKYIN